jgi:phage terminase Nu1 subunit (DNA packaging protein)
MREISGSELAELTGKTWRTVKALLEAASIRPRRRQGRADLYDSEIALSALYLSPGDGMEYDDQRQRLAAAQAEKVEHDNAVRRGELAPRADVVRFWAECQVAARAKFLGIGTKLSPRLVNIADANVIAAAIRAEVIAALAEFVDFEPVESPEVVGGDAVKPDASADPHGKRVGRPRAAAVNGKQRRARPVAN